MFFVRRKNSDDIKIVYNIQYKRGYPFFMLYENGQWITRSAKYYVPIDNFKTKS